MYDEQMERWKQEFRRQLDSRPSEWTIADGLSAKITPDDRMNAFYGATTVIRLAETDREAVRRLQADLMEAAPDMLVPVDPATFHLTIHALSNVYSAGPEPDDVRRSIAAHEPLVEAEFRRIRADYGGRVVRMTALGVSTSGKDVVSVKYIPESRDDFDVLTDLFDRIEAIYPLRRPYAPHVTLGYFRLRRYDAAEIERLYDAMARLSRERALGAIELPVDGLAYQLHRHMNDFRDVFTVGSL